MEGTHMERHRATRAATSGLPVHTISMLCTPRVVSLSFSAFQANCKFQRVAVDIKAVSSWARRWAWLHLVLQPLDLDVCLCDHLGTLSAVALAPEASLSHKLTDIHRHKHSAARADGDRACHIKHVSTRSEPRRIRHM